jgi:type III secretion protein J
MALLLPLLMLGGCKQQLYTGLSERDANEMLAVLGAHGIEADKVIAEKGDFKLELDRSDFSAAIEALRDSGLPRAKFSSIGEVFKKEGLVTTANAERLRFMYAMSEELSRTLSLIDGVVEARVHPVLPGGDPLTDKLTPASASVFIKHSPGADLSLLGPTIKDLVCASIEGLAYERVSVTFVAASKMALAASAAPTTASAPLSLSTLGMGLAASLVLAGIAVLLAMRRAPGGAAAAAALPARRRWVATGQALRLWLQRMTPGRKAAPKPQARPAKAAAKPARPASEPVDEQAPPPAARDAVVPIQRARRQG